jgi:hypothetical protein
MVDSAGRAAQAGLKSLAALTRVMEKRCETQFILSAEGLSESGRIPGDAFEMNAKAFRFTIVTGGVREY